MQRELPKIAGWNRVVVGVVQKVVIVQKNMSEYQTILIKALFVHLKSGTTDDQSAGVAPNLGLSGYQS